MCVCFLSLPVVLQPSTELKVQKLCRWVSFFHFVLVLFKFLLASASLFWGVELGACFKQSPPSGIQLMDQVISMAGAVRVVGISKQTMILIVNAEQSLSLFYHFKLWEFLFIDFYHIKVENLFMHSKYDGIWLQWLWELSVSSSLDILNLGLWPRRRCFKVVDLGDPDGGAAVRSVKLDAGPPLAATQQAERRGLNMRLGSFLCCPFLFDQELKNMHADCAESTVSIRVCSSNTLLTQTTDPGNTKPKLYVHLARRKLIKIAPFEIMTTCNKFCLVLLIIRR